MRAFFSKKNLFLRVAVGFALGVILGFAAPGFSIAVKVVGDLYLNLIKLMIIPIVVCAVFCGIANIRDGALLRKIGVRTVALYVVMFVFSAAVSLAVAYAVRPGLGTVFENAPVYEGAVTNPTVSSFLMTIVPTNIVKAAADGSTLPVILFTIVFACAIVSAGEKGRAVPARASSRRWPSTSAAAGCAACSSSSSSWCCRPACTRRCRSDGCCAPAARSRS